jgi:Transglycosylase SLT domain
MRPLVLAVALVAVLGPAAGRAQTSPSALCRGAITAAERALGVPDRLMQAIGVVESGRPDERGGVTAWPWTINVEGTGYIFDTKAEAIAAVNSYRAQGARSIDVGCMQVNLLHHGDAFASLEQAFDPVANARYAAEFLQRLLAQTGSWPRAAAGYHSMTPDVGADYARKVLAVWARPGLGEPVPFQTVRRGAMAASFVPSAGAFTSSAPATPRTPSAGGIAMLGSPTARVLPVASASGGGNGGAVGRGLAAYRSAPTRLATSLYLPRG